MSDAIKALKEQDEYRDLMRLSAVQAAFLQRYRQHVPAEDQHEFERDVMYMLQLTYREACLPLTKQITDFLMTQNRPMIWENLK